jgi:hypothetical protein
VVPKNLAKENPKKQEEIRTLFLLAVETRDIMPDAVPQPVP